MSRCLAALRTLGTRFFGVASVLLLLAVPAIAQSASLTSDKGDYPPGATAELTGAGFQPGETVTLQVLHADGSPSNGADHDPWYVVADAQGGFVTTWHVCEDDCVGEELRATAIGQASGISGSCLFTDAPCVGAANLDQARNGGQAGPVSPVDMQNGNLGSQQSHYVEGQSVPYRAVLTDLPIGESLTITLGFDIKHSNRHALDYLTHYNRMQPHTYASHITPETVDPLVGLVGFPVTFSTFPIPAPTSVSSPVLGQPTASFNALPAAERLMTLYGGTITAIVYLNQGNLTAAQSEAQVNVTFTPTSNKAVLAWGGHIGTRLDWGFVAGVPRSAGGISGSPYHMRLKSWINNDDPPCLSNLGNQDRSLSADAVVPPPTCGITGSDLVCCGTTNSYSAVTDILTATYLWSLTGNTSGASISGSNTGSSVQVLAGSGGNYTVQVAITANGFTTTCSLPVTVRPGQPVFAALPPPSTIECPATPAFATPSVSDICDPAPVLTFVDVRTNGACPAEYTVTRTWTAVDACGASATASQVIQVEDNAAPVLAGVGGPQTIECPASPAFSSPSASDLCDPNPGLSFVDVRTAGNCPAEYSVTRTWTAVDNCGNTAVASQTITVEDNTGPVISCPSDIAVGECDATVSFVVSATDDCDGAPTIVSVPPSGTTFPVGETIVTVTATDACGNTTTCTFKVKVTRLPTGVVAGPSEICQGESTQLCGPDGNFSYSWTGPGGLNAGTKCITATLAGTYSLVLTDNLTDCVGLTIIHELTVNPRPSCAIVASNVACDRATYCAPDGSYMYLWTGPNGFLSTERCITVTGTGDYSLALTDLVTRCASSCVQHFDRTPCFENCPRTVGFWGAQCDNLTNPASRYTNAQLLQIITCIDTKAGIFFPGSGTLMDKFCAIIKNNKTDQRSQAKRQFAALLANICAGELSLTPPNGNQIFMDLDTPVSCGGLGATTLGQLIAEVDVALLTLEGLPIKNAAVKQEYSRIITCLDALNNGRITDSTCPLGTQAISALDSHSVSAPLVGDDSGSSADDGSSADIESAGELVELYRPWPNPFTNSSRIAYYVATEGERTQIGVYNAAGRRVRDLTSGFQPVGRHEVIWNGTADDGSRVQHGVYFVRIVVAGVQRNMRLIYLQ